jgi:hypothetical protein
VAKEKIAATSILAMRAAAKGEWQISGAATRWPLRVSSDVADNTSPTH